MTGEAVRRNAFSVISVADWLDQHFDRVAPFLQAALDAEPIVTHHLEDVREAIADDRAQLWVTQNSAIVTEIKDYPSGVRIMHYWLSGGNLGEIIALLPVIEDYGRLAGCVGIDVRGRRGWQPIVKHLGYRAVGTHYFKDL